MANKRISDLPGAGAASESDQYIVVQGLSTRSQTLTQIRAAILSAWLSFIGAFLSASTPAAARAAIGAIGSADNITGSAAKLSTPRTLSASGDATWSVNFDGSGNATAALTLAASGVAAGTYGAVTVSAKGIVTAAQTATPIANGGTGATSASAALANLLGAPLASPTFTGTPSAPTPAVGTNTTQIATSAMIQAEIANKRAWTGYTPTVTAASGTYTTVAVSAKYLVAFGVCFVQITLTFTNKGSGVTPIFTLPFPALAGSAGNTLNVKESAANGHIGLAVIAAGLTTAVISDYLGADIVSSSGAVVTITGSYPIA